MSILKRFSGAWKVVVCLVGLGALTGCADGYYGYAGPGWAANSGVYYDPGFYGYYGPDYFDYYGPYYGGYHGGYYGRGGRGFHDFDHDRRFGHGFRQGGFAAHGGRGGRGGFARGSRGGSVAHGGGSHGGHGGHGR